jgi:hypothetical protein
MKYVILYMLLFLQSCSIPLSKNVDIYIRNDYGNDVCMKIEDPERVMFEPLKDQGYIYDMYKAIPSNSFILYSAFDYNKKSMSDGVMPLLVPLDAYFRDRYDWFGSNDTKITIYDNNESIPKVIYEYIAQDLTTMPINNNIQDKSYLTEDTYFFVLTKEGLKRYTYKTMPPSLRDVDNKNDEIINKTCE